MIEARVDRVAGLDGALEPVPLPVPGIERKSIRRGGAVKLPGRGEIVSRDMNAAGHCRERVGIALAAGECAEHAALDVCALDIDTLDFNALDIDALDLGGAQRVMQI